MSDVLRDLVKETTAAVVREILPRLAEDARPRLMSLEDSARYLDISVTVLREMIARGEMTPVRVSERCIKCDRRELDNLIEERKRAA